MSVEDKRIRVAFLYSGRRNLQHPNIILEHLLQTDDRVVCLIIHTSLEELQLHSTHHFMVYMFS